jgi:peptidoglycan/LPS O-acetylase OafA/YrhL
MKVQPESAQGVTAGSRLYAHVRQVITGRMPALDGMRGAGMVVVLIVHFSWTPFGLPGLGGRLLLSIIPAGWIAMASFFVLSGFLITGILLDSKGAENYFSSFYARRALRILPLYYGSLFVGFILFPLLGKLGLPYFPKQFLAGQVWYWFYVGNLVWMRLHAVPYFDHFWSLAVEEQFYFLWPLIIYMTRRRTLAKICIGLVVVAPILRILLYLRGVNPEGIYRLTTSHIDALGLGALAALIVRDENWTRRLVPRLNYFVYPSLAIFCVMCVAMDSFDYEGPAFIYGASWVAIFFTGLVLRLVATTGTNSRLQRFLQWGWLQSCGKYSYAIYVLHFPLTVYYYGTVLPRFMDYLRQTGLRDWFHHRSMFDNGILVTAYLAHIFVLCLVSFGLGKLSWWAFEGPINDRKKYFKPRWRSSMPKPTEA